jgi:putative oxidoreductase
MSQSLEPLASSEATELSDPRAFVADSRLGTTAESRGASYAALIRRLALGTVFLAHAYLKAAVLTLPGTVAFFEAHGIPGWSAYPVFIAELVGGLAFIAGVYTRWVAAALLPVMLGALAVHWPNGWSFTAPDGGWEYIAFLIAMLLAHALAGNGADTFRSTRRHVMRHD